MYNILVCDDEKDIVSALRIYLTAEGYRVYEAGNGREALEYLAKEDIQLVLMDIMMPVMDGLEATREIRTMNRSDASAVVIIAMTANAFAEDKSKALKAGMDEYLTKPLESEKLIRALSRYKHN